MLDSLDLPYIVIMCHFSLTFECIRTYAKPRRVSCPQAGPQGLEPCVLPDAIKDSRNNEPALFQYSHALLNDLRAHMSCSQRSNANHRIVRIVASGKWFGEIPLQEFVNIAAPGNLKHPRVDVKPTNVLGTTFGKCHTYQAGSSARIQDLQMTDVGILGQSLYQS